MTLDKRTVALGVAAAAAVVAAATVTAVDRKPHASRERRDVGAYIDAVNAIQAQMQRPLSRVLLAYRSFAPGKHAGAELARAARTLRRLDRRLAAVTAPPEARTLRRRLLELVARQAEMTGEIGAITRFVPRFDAVLARARAADRVLSRRLSSARVPAAERLHGTRAQIAAQQRAFDAGARRAAAAQAAALTAFDAQLLAVDARLRRLEPPRAFAPAYHAQRRAFADIVAAGDRLAAELRTTRATNVAATNRRFTVALREAESLAAQRAQIAAVRAYNARVVSLRTAGDRVQAELQRLQVKLP